MATIDGKRLEIAREVQYSRTKLNAVLKKLGHDLKDVDDRFGTASNSRRFVDGLVDMFDCVATWDEGTTALEDAYYETQAKKWAPKVIKAALERLQAAEDSRGKVKQDDKQEEVDGSTSGRNAASAGLGRLSSNSGPDDWVDRISCAQKRPSSADDDQRTPKRGRLSGLRTPSQPTTKEMHSAYLATLTEHDDKRAQAICLGDGPLAYPPSCLRAQNLDFATKDAELGNTDVQDGSRQKFGLDDASSRVSKERDCTTSQSSAGNKHNTRLVCPSPAVSIGKPTAKRNVAASRSPATPSDQANSMMSPMEAPGSSPPGTQQRNGRRAISSSVLLPRAFGGQASAAMGENAMIGSRAGGWDQGPETTYDPMEDFREYDGAAYNALTQGHELNDHFVYATLTAFNPDPTVWFIFDPLERRSRAKCEQPRGLHLQTKLLFPIHIHSPKHWVLGCVNRDSSTYAIYDSLARPDSKQQEHLDAMQKYVQDLGLCSDRLTCVRGDTHALRQTNTIDCGLYVVLHGLHLMHNLDLSQLHAADWRDLLSPMFGRQGQHASSNTRSPSSTSPDTGSCTSALKALVAVRHRRGLQITMLVELVARQKRNLDNFQRRLDDAQVFQQWHTSVYRDAPACVVSNPSLKPVMEQEEAKNKAVLSQKSGTAAAIHRLNALSQACSREADDHAKFDNELLTYSQQRSPLVARSGGIFHADSGDQPRSGVPGQQRGPASLLSNVMAFFGSSDAPLLRAKLLTSDTGENRTVPPVSPSDPVSGTPYCGWCGGPCLLPLQIEGWPDHLHPQLYDIFHEAKRIADTGKNRIQRAWMSGLQLATIAIDCNGSPNLARERGADVLLMSAEAFRIRTKSNEKILKPIVVQEVFDDAGEHTLDTFAERLNDTYSGMKIQVQGGKGLQGREVHELIARLKEGQPDNALSLTNLTRAIEPKFTHNRRFHLLADLSTRTNAFRQGDTAKQVRRYSDVSSCQGFNLLAGRGAFSGAHVDALAGTWVRMLFGNKIWHVVPDNLMKPCDWNEFGRTGDKWLPDGKGRGIPLGPDDVVVLQGLKIHAVSTTSCCGAQGGMMWDRKRLSGILDELYWTGCHQIATNEAIPLELPEILQALEGLEGDGDHKNKDKIKQLLELRCDCRHRCLHAECSCWIGGRRCTPWCNNHSSAKSRPERSCLYERSTKGVITSRDSLMG